MEFSKELSIGNRVLDCEHRKLHGIISEINSAIKAREVAVLLEGFAQLENCLSAYFVIEEKIAQAVGFDFKQHHVAHQDLMYKFQILKAELADKITDLSTHDEKSYTHLLCRYLKLHILFDSAPLEVVLSTHYYDFQPEQ